MVSPQILSMLDRSQILLCYIVLPRFDVLIIPPKFVTKDQQNIKITFHAKYLALMAIF